MSEAFQSTGIFYQGPVPDLMPDFDKMSEQMGFGSLPNLFNAIANMQTEALRIAVHAPFVPFHIYAEAIEIRTPMVAMMEKAEEAATHVAETMNHNTQVLQQEAADTAANTVDAVANTVKEATPQKSASPRAKTASGPSAGSGS